MCSSSEGKLFIRGIVLGLVVTIAGLLFTAVAVNSNSERAGRVLLPSDELPTKNVPRYTFIPVEPADPDWWKTTVIYQIYPRSYADSDGDGIGDLPGITSRLDYIASLGVRAIWISPFYESPQDDMGYDVTNFTRVDPVYGTNQDFAVLVEEAHRRGIRVIMDLVPGHTSYKCDWFQKSRRRIGEYTDYYVWHAGDPKRPVFISPSNETRNGVPNNWVAVFGNSMWSWDSVRREYYLHQFLKEQPDLNYRSPRVHEEMRNVMLFWLDKGADGFRIDAFAHTSEAEPYLNNDEPWNPLGSNDPALYESFLHTKTKNQPETFALLREWHEMIRDYAVKNHRDHIFTVTEVYGDTVDQSMHYDTYNGKKGADFCYNFNLINITNANGHDIERAIRVWLEHLPSGKGWPNYVTGNHDNGRVISRLQNNPNLVDGLNMLLLLLPGTPTTYYGEEIGMTNNINITLEQVRDKNALTPAHISTWTRWTRDYERTPMQWTNQLPHAGFSPDTAESGLPWLPVNYDATLGINVQAQMENVAVSDRLPTTHLGVYKKLLQLRSRKPFLLSKTMDSALVTPSLYSFIRKDDEHPGGSPAYLIALDLRRNGTDVVQYDFSQALKNADLPSSGTIVVQSTAARTTSELWKLAEAQKTIIDWTKISLLPGESFVAEFMLNDTQQRADRTTAAKTRKFGDKLLSFWRRIKSLIH